MLYLVRKNVDNKEVYINEDGTIEKNINNGYMYNEQDAEVVAKKFKGYLLSDMAAFPEDYDSYDDYDY